jgi:hypothetical protein
MLNTMTQDEYLKMMKSVGKKYMPAEPKKKRQLTMKQIFFLNGKRALGKAGKMA